MKRKTLYIVVEGGVLQDVCCEDAGAVRDLDVVLIDYDSEGLPEDETQVVLDADGKPEKAMVRKVEISSPMLVKPPTTVG